MDEEPATYNRPRGVSFSSRLEEALVAEAQRRDRSVSWLVRQAVEAWLKDNAQREEAES